MRFTLLAGVALAGLILGGCASVPAPVAAGSKNVVVAELVLNATNLTPSTANGLWTDTLSIKLLNWDTKENFTATTVAGQSGLVTFTNLPPGTYSVREMGASLVYMTNTVFTTTYPKPVGALFELVEGKVNNLGRIEWKQDKATQSYAVANYDAVKVDAGKAALAQVGLEWADVKFTTEE